MAQAPLGFVPRIVIATGGDSTGYLARCTRWFAEKGPHGEGRPVLYNWRAHWARSISGHGFSMLYFDAAPDFDPDLAGFQAQEKGRRDRYITIADADRLLFDIFDDQSGMKALQHFYCSFQHIDDRGFLSRLCGELTARGFGLVQHDSVMLKAPAAGEKGIVDHALRCYLRWDWSKTLINKELELCLKAASSEQPPTKLRCSAPESHRGTVRGALPIECREGLPLACIYFLGSLGGAFAQDELTNDLDRAMAGLVSTNKAFGTACDVAETMREIPNDVAKDKNRPVVRWSMRKLGGWTAIVACVPVQDAGEARSLGRILKKKLTDGGLVTRTLQCDGVISPESPWASNGPQKHLELEHYDRPGYLADYFRHINEPTEEASIIQYDSYAQASRWADHGGQPIAHHCIAISEVNAPAEVTDVRQRKYTPLALWKTRHHTWIGQEKRLGHRGGLDSWTARLLKFVRRVLTGGRQQ